MVLHDVADDSELIKVSTASFRSERLFEGDQHAGDTLTVPRRAKQSIAEPVKRKKKKKKKFDSSNAKSLG